MKKNVRYVLAAVILVVLLVTVFWEPVLDALPIDQSGWRESKGHRYYRGEKGDILTGWQEVDGQWYYLDPAEKGAMATGWLEQENKRCYLTDSGVMATGWTEVEGKSYYFTSDGVMAVGWVEDNGQRYYLNEAGNPQNGWLELDGKKYYLQQDGAVTTGWLEMAGKRYYFDTDGHMATGWVTTGEGRYYLNEDGTACIGWLVQESGRYYMEDDGKLHAGWLDWEGDRYYMDESGAMHTGWLETEEGRYYLGEDGIMRTGWLDWASERYYLQSDGTAAKGSLEIQERTYHFTSTGMEILLVNPWNPLPEDYSVELVYTVNGARVAAECDEALRQMLEDCKKAGYTPCICSSYRTTGTQQVLFSRKIGYWQSMGCDYETAYNKAKQAVAVPGTSEHHTGLAVDIVDSGYQHLNKQQAERPTQKWLMEHCWEYGFILRYPVGTTEITGIIYEPWHYRYVGTELAAELHELDMCLEEYLTWLSQEEAPA